MTRMTIFSLPQICSHPIFTRLVSVNLVYSMKMGLKFRIAYGTVLRFDVGFLIPANRADDKADPAGEWGPLGTAAWLLCKLRPFQTFYSLFEHYLTLPAERFGERGRPYPKHAPKPFPIAMLEESVRMWAPEMRTTLSHKFRGMRDSTGQWDAYITFLTSHLIIERSREALLWSWIVGRVGGNKDEWGPLEKTQAWRELGGDPHYPEKDIHVSLTDRETMTEENIVNNLKSSGLNYSRRTKYQFCELFLVFCRLQRLTSYGALFSKSRRIPICIQES